MITDKSQTHEQLELANIPANIKLVEEGKIDVENIEEGLEHKLFCQRTVKQTPQKIRIQKIAEKSAVLKAENEASLKAWCFIKAEDFLVTTNCPICEEQHLLRIDRPVCSACEDKYELRGIVA